MIGQRFQHIPGDACEKFQNYCIDSIELNIEQINQYVDRWLMLVSAVSPVIGYDKASAIVHDADRSGRTLREAALDSGRSAPKTSTESSTRPTWLARSRRSVLVEQRNGMSSQATAVAERPSVVGVRRARWCLRRVGCVARGARRGRAPGR